jgi:hypothetical protein
MWPFNPETIIIVVALVILLYLLTSFVKYKNVDKEEPNSVSGYKIYASLDQNNDSPLESKSIEEEREKRSYSPLFAHSFLIAMSISFVLAISSAAFIGRLVGRNGCGVGTIPYVWGAGILTLLISFPIVFLLSILLLPKGPNDGEHQD